ncbi:hypothetical protein PHYPSEUDO_001243 [Phytophthora pseudosyringae]|uniref:Uncharacterized protein n=1 Tax=Phytophthora pseudosyringae TaxID=221518 RepID=A0A8T1VWK6_9STRA|nr:hypothetical protein PHYPSEUDO_001243 [Phytophthora pseudosyringae]
MPAALLGPIFVVGDSEVVIRQHTQRMPPRYILEDTLDGGRIRSDGMEAHNERIQQGNKRTRTGTYDHGHQYGVGGGVRRCKRRQMERHFRTRAERRTTVAGGDQGTRPLGARSTHGVTFGRGGHHPMRSTEKIANLAPAHKAVAGNGH